MTLDDIVGQVEPYEADRNAVSRRVVDVLRVLNMQVDEATGEIVGKPQVAKWTPAEQTQVWHSGMRRTGRRR